MLNPWSLVYYGTTVGYYGGTALHGQCSYNATAVGLFLLLLCTAHRTHNTIVRIGPYIIYYIVAEHGLDAGVDMRRRTDSCIL
jgi:hypothetical protein